MSVWLDNLQDEYVRCRKLGHAWEEIGWQKMGARRVHHGLVIRCTRCATERFDIYDTVGWLDDRRYRYPEGYKKPIDTERPAFNELSRALRTRGKRPKSLRSPVLEGMAEKIKGKKKS